MEVSSTQLEACTLSPTAQTVPGTQVRPSPQKPPVHTLRVDGESVGTAVGLREGEAVGTEEGSLDGVPEGVAVLESVLGFTVGVLVGSTVGLAEGVLVGATEGPAEGGLEGCAVGDLVDGTDGA